MDASFNDADAPFHAPNDPMTAPIVPPVGVAETVRYLTREWRNGRKEFAAIVTKVSEHGTLDLVVVFDADDFISLRDVPMQPAPGEVGWLPVVRHDDGDAVSSDRFNEFQAEVATVLFGDNLKPDVSFVDQLLAMEARLDRLEAAGDGAVSVPVRGRRRGAPK